MNAYKKCSILIIDLISIILLNVVVGLIIYIISLRIDIPGSGSEGRFGVVLGFILLSLQFALGIISFIIIHLSGKRNNRKIKMFLFFILNIPLVLYWLALSSECVFCKLILVNSFITLYVGYYYLTKLFYKRGGEVRQTSKTNE